MTSTNSQRPTPKNLDLSTRALTFSQARADRATAAREADEYDLTRISPRCWRVVRRDDRRRTYLVDTCFLSCSCQDFRANVAPLNAEVEAEWERAGRPTPKPGKQLCKHLDYVVDEIAIAELQAMESDSESESVFRQEFEDFDFPLLSSPVDEGKRYRVVIHQDGGTYPSGPACTMAEAEARVEATRKFYKGSDLFIVASIVELGAA